MANNPNNNKDKGLYKYAVRSTKTNEQLAQADAVRHARQHYVDSMSVNSRRIAPYGNISFLRKLQNSIKARFSPQPEKWVEVRE